MTLQLTRYRFHVDDYYRLAEAGILKEDDRVELIHGEIIKMNPIGSRHAGCVFRLNHLLSRQVKSNLIVGVQSPIRISEHSEPEPDLMILKHRDDFYTKQHPQPEDVLLVIEVADSSLSYDQQVKIPLYAEAKIPEVWLVNLDENIVEIYCNPDGNSYQDVQRYQQNDTIPLQALELNLNARQILG